MEADCAPQREARARLARMREELGRLRVAQSQGRAPSPSDPTQAAIEAEFEREMARLEREGARPAAARLPANAAPPRAVLSAAASLVLLQEAPGGAHATFTVTRYIHDDDGRMYVGFSITAAPEPNVCVATLQWKHEFGTWPALNWAWLLALTLRKLPLRCDITTISLTYKLQDAPNTAEFRPAMHDAFADVCRTARLAEHCARFERATFFGSDRDIDKQNDLAYFFDTQLWRVAANLGFAVEDRSHAPALSYFVRDTTCPVDATRKRWPSTQAYVRARLTSAARDAALSEEDAERHMSYLWELLNTQHMGEVRSSDTQCPMGELWRMYEEYAESKLGKKLCRLAAKYSIAAPAALATQVGRRCDACNLAEGQNRNDDGALGGKLKSCACNPGGAPFFCNRACQKAGWPAHREFCTAAPDETKSNTSGRRKKG
jgi:hypothetical protein